MSDETKTEVNNLGEAPASATVKIKSSSGFEWLFTIRDESAKTLMFKMRAMEANWLKNGFTPLTQSSWGKKEKAPVEYIQGQVCPVDGGRLVKPPTGSKAPIKCENQKYDFQTKTTSGCSYKLWPQPIQPKPVTRPEEDYIPLDE